MKRLMRNTGSRISSRFLKRYYDIEALQLGNKKDSQYAKGNYFQNRLWDERTKVIKENVSSLQSFLDIGCAEGYVIAIIKELFGPRVYCVGLDISEIYLKRGKQSEIEGQFILGDAQFLPLYCTPKVGQLRKQQIEDIFQEVQQGGA